MEEKLERKQLRKHFSSVGWPLLIYMLILNACVALAMAVDMVFISLRQMNGETINETQMYSILTGNGWGYLLTIAIGLVILWIWKGKYFCTQTLWIRGRPMKASDFVCLLCLFLSGQVAFQYIATAVEALLNLFGLTAMADYEAATMTSDTLSMFLYSCVGAPIAEEILFRGLVLRQLEPYGKRFAILFSALLFGVFHANLLQIPYAFLVGLVLAYVALEYNILWAMVLHMINNLVLSDLMPRLMQGLPDAVTNAVFNTLLMGCAMAAVIILLVNRGEIKAYRQENRIGGKEAGCFFTSPGIIALFIAVAGSLISDLAAQVI